MRETDDRIRRNKNRYFVNGAFRHFFIPAIASTFWQAVAGVADSVFVGNAIGAAGLAAIGFGQPIYLFYNILSYGLSIGGSIHYAARMAEGRKEEGNRIFITILKILLSIYMVTAALGILFLPQLMGLLGADPADEVTRAYIRTQLLFVPIMFLQGPLYYFVNADSGPKAAAVALSLSGVMDAVFSYIFVIKMDLGIVGSVYSTVVGALLMLGITGGHVLQKKGQLRFQWEKTDWKTAALSVKTGFATSTEYLFEFITMIAVNRMLARMGGNTAVAVFNVVYNVSLLCNAIPQGTVVAIEPMLSSYRSERIRFNIRHTLKLALIRGGMASLLFALVCLTFAQEFGMLFGMKPGQEMTFATRGIYIYALSILPAMLNLIFGGYYQAILREKFAYVITLLRSLTFYLTAVLLCNYGSIREFWYVFVISEVSTLIIWGLIALFYGGLDQLQKMDTSHASTVIVDSSVQNISQVSQELQEFCRKNGTSEAQAAYVGLTVEELCSAIVDRFRDQMGKIYVQATVIVENGETQLYLRDNAYSFNPLGENTEEIDMESGEKLNLLGIRIVQKKAKEFFYRRYSGFNTMVIRL